MVEFDGVNDSVMSHCPVWFTILLTEILAQVIKVPEAEVNLKVQPFLQNAEG